MTEAPVKLICQPIYNIDNENKDAKWNKNTNKH